MFIIALLVIVICSISIVSANVDGDNLTVVDESAVKLDNNEINEIESVSENVSSHEILKSDSLDDEIIVNDWNELQYYCQLSDKDYTVKLKENTNFYPTNMDDKSEQIKIKNNVKIIGSKGSYIGDASSSPRAMRYTGFLVEDGARFSLSFENVSFKWIKLSNPIGVSSGIFIQMGAKDKYTNVFKNCQFSNCVIQSGHSCIVYLKKGSAILDNCSFISCTCDYGVVSIYDPNSVKTTNMIIRNSYFENNYASIEPGCINNCGKVTVYNTTFIKNRAHAWAGAIHTHYYGNTTIYDSKFIDNVAGWNGGALYTYSDLQIYNSVFIGNNCTTNNGGGAIGACVYYSQPHIYIEGCLFEKNANNCWALDDLSTEGTGRGGAISIMDAGSLVVHDTTFVANAASIGTAICAMAAGSYGSPAIIITNNSFVNHTREGDTLIVRNDGSSASVSDNYYYGNSIVFSNLTLTKVSESREQASFKITAEIKNPTYYDLDILDKTCYEVYINDKYVKTVNSTTFSIDFGDLDICGVYVIPTISNRKSNEVTVASTREYVFVSKSNGSDSNNGISRETPVSTIRKALELARVCQNIIILDGQYSEENIGIDYDVTIKGENDATLTNKTSFVTSSNFSLKNMRINSLNTSIFIKDSGNLIIKNCIFNNNNASKLIESKNTEISKSIFTNNDAVILYNNGVASIHDSILLNNSDIIKGSLNNVDFDYNWWGSTLPDLNIENYLTLNVTSNTYSLENNQKASVNFAFYLNGLTKYNNLPEIDLKITAVNGSSNKAEVNINEGVVFTLTGFEDGLLSAGYNGVKSDFTFNFIKSTPNIQVETNDVMFGRDVVVTVTAPRYDQCNLSVTVGNITQNKEIKSTNTIFTFSNLKADSYEVLVNYTGDKKYAPQLKTSNVKVSKYESTVTLEIGAIEVNKDIILTITTISTSTGNVTLSINNNSETLILNNSKANYTMKTVPRGDYLISAVYNGDEKYLPSADSKFIEVDNLESNIDVSINPIVYGDDLIVNVKVNDDATGFISVAADGISNSSKISNAHARIILSKLDAGINKKLSVFYSGDNNYFNKTVLANYTINKADLDFSISYADIMIGDIETIGITVPAKTTGTFTINGTRVNIPLSGVVEYDMDNIEVGNYTITVTYNGNNYKSISKNIKFSVFEYDSPQWANPGGNTQNTQKSPYDSNTNGEIAFSIPIDEEITGDLVIDSEGNVYITTRTGIYSFNVLANMRWYFTSNAAEGNFSGVAISRDVVVAPKAGDTLYFINQSTGEKYESNIYQGSSVFAPVIDSNSNVYTVSEYQFSQVGGDGYNLVITPFNLWKNGGDPITVALGKSEPICSAVVGDNIIAMLSYDSSQNKNMLRIIDASTLQLTSKSGFALIRPVIGDGDVIYAALSSSIVAYGKNFNVFWKTPVTGGVGNHLVLDNQQGLYHVNAKGLLYKYDLISGEESKVSDLKVTSGILIGSEGNLYFGCDNTFYALDSEGNILWKSYVGSKITGSPVMDKNGLIYVATQDNKVVALSHHDLRDSNLQVDVADIVEGQDAKLTITLNNQTTGSIVYSVNGMDYSLDAEMAKVTKTISGLDVGEYVVNVAYSGDGRFNPIEISKKFKVRSRDDIANFITFDENSTFSISLKNAQGNLTVYINDNSYTSKLTNGNADVKVTGLNPGDYNALVIYSGDGVYQSANRTFKLNVPKINVNLNESVIVDNVVANISVLLPEDAGGDLTLTIGIRKDNAKIINGFANFIIDDLGEGSYLATIAYSGDNKYESASKDISFTLSRIKIVLDANNLEVISPSSNPSITVNLNNDATGNFTVKVDGEEYPSQLVDGKANVILDDLTPGNYTAFVFYSGDTKYSNASIVVNVEVPKIVLEFNESTLIFTCQENNVNFTINLPTNATGEITVSIKDKKQAKTLKDGNAVIEFNDLHKGNYEAIVNYSGDDNHESISKTLRFSISMIDVELNATTLNVENMTVSVKLNDDATGTLTVLVKDKEFKKALVNGHASLNVIGLAPGEYDATVIYSGDEKYSIADKDITLTVPKIKSDLDGLIVKSNVSVPSISIDFKNDATGTLTVNVGGKNYTSNVTNGASHIDITGLAPGNYSATVTYSGDTNYTVASKTINLEVPKIKTVLDETTLKIDLDNASIRISLSLPGDAAGTLTVTVDKENYTADVVGGKATVNIPSLGEGTHNITVYYSDDDKYDFAFKELTVNVNGTESKENPNLSVSVDDVNVGENIFISITTSVESGKVIVNVDNKDYEVTISNGKADLTILDLALGKYTVTVRFDGDDKYDASLVSENFTVNDVAPLINVPIEVVIADNSRADIYMENVTGNVSVIVDGKEIRTALDKGKTSVKLNNLAGGDHSVIVVFDGDDTYAPAHALSSFKTGISTEFDQITLNDDMSLSMVLKDQFGNVIANDPVSYDIKGISKTALTDLNGAFTISAKNGDEITVKYGGNNTFTATMLKLTLNIRDVFSVVKVDSRFNIPGNAITIRGYAVDVNAGEEGIYYSTKLLDSKGNPLKGKDIQFAVNNKIYNRTTYDDGSFDPYKLNMVRAGRYTMAFYFKGDDDHSSTFACVCVDLAKKPITIKASAKTYKASAKKKYTVTLSTVAGSSHDGKVYLSPKKVTLTLNGKTYSGTTNKNGQVTFNLKLTKKGKYTAQINFEGDNTYESAAKSVKVTIK